MAQVIFARALSSPYQDFLAEQVQEILDRFTPVDGIWFDMCWDQPSWSHWALAGMAKAGLDPESEADHRTYARQVTRAYMRRYTDLVRARNPDAWLYFNCRPLEVIRQEIDCFRQYEIESLPSGGWGYDHFARVVRYARTLGLPYLGMTGKFHNHWGDFGGLKPQAALDYETSLMAAHGAACCVGDQLHPRGRLDRATYDRIGASYRRIAAREPWLIGATPVSEMAILSPGDDAEGKKALSGVVRMAKQLRWQADVLLPEQDFSAYRLVVLPDLITVDAPLAQRLQDHVRRGGLLLASGRSGLDPAGTRSVLPCLGISVEGPSLFSATYIRAGEDIANLLPPGDNVMYERGWRVKPSDAGRALATVVEPYFERTFVSMKCSQG